jgi:enoyl-CoA hydratase
MASENAKMGLNIALGVIPGYGGTQRLPSTSRKGRMEMIMTAGMVTAQDAYRIGLVNP